MSVPFFWMMVFGFAVATFSAIAFHVIKEMPWHEMEDYCQLRSQKTKADLFGTIFDQREKMELGAGVLQMVTLAIAVSSTVAWFLSPDGVPEMTPGRVLTTSGLIALALVVTQVWIPRAAAKFAAPAFLYRTWRWWRVVSLASFPFLMGERFVSEMFARASGQEEDEDADEEAVEDEILSLASEAQHDGLLESQTVDMLEGIMDLNDFTVTKVMKPRSGVDAMDVATDWKEMLTFVVQSGRTRIPIFEGKIDNIVGILFAKDLLRESLKKPIKRKSLSKLIRPPMTVLATTQLDTMLREFLAGRMHMAIVRDEYGGLAGVVTIEDVLEEIVGEIVDETDAEEEALIRRCGKLAIEVDGRAPIDMVNEELATQLPEVDDFATVAGLLMWELKELPRPGKQVVVDNVRFEVKEVNRRTIRTVRIEVIDVDRYDSP
jgi:CBS domain containing-hemolysin-like protein